MKLAHLTAALALAVSPVYVTVGLAQDAAVATIVDAQQFADTASSSNTFEIESSQLALERSQNEEVLSFAERMIADHTAAGESMMAAAQEDGITPAANMMEKHQQMLDELNTAEGEQFDTAYLDAQVMAHDEAVALFEGYSTEGEEGALKAFAAETLPVLQEHQEHVHNVAGN